MTELSDDDIAKLSDFVDGALSGDARAEVAAKIDADEAWKVAHDDMVGTRDALSGMQKARAPASFAQDVTATIHKRSRGSLFAKRSAGDKVPFMALLVLALLAVMVVAYVMWASGSGSLHSAPSAPEGPSGDGSALAPRP
jgi:anti-sigma factor RsiW